MTAEAFCGNCGDKLDSGARFCTGCGSPVLDQQPYVKQPPNLAPRPLDPRSSSRSVVGTPSTYTPEQLALYESRRKGTVTALLLSIIPGLGQVYVGRVARAAGYWVLAIILTLTFFGIAFLPILWLANIVDAYWLANQYNTELMRGMK